MKHSIMYFVGIVISIMWLIFSNFNLNYTHRCNSFISNFMIPAKSFAKSFINCSMTLSEYLLQNKHLKKEIAELKMTNNKLKSALTTVTDLKNELDELKKAVDFRYKTPPCKIIEKVLGFDKGMYESFMLISVTHDSIKSGDVVISGNGLIGRIYDINDTVARVMHICDQKINIPVVSQSGDHMILSGSGKEFMFSKEIKTNANTIHLKSKKKELLITSGEGGIFQHGIPVAHIMEINGDTLIAQPVDKIDNVDFVWILQPIMKENSN